MSDKSDDILKSLGKLKPDEMRQVIENLAKQSPNAQEWATPVLDKLAHLPNRLTADEIVERASLRVSAYYYLITDGVFETCISSLDASTQEEAIRFARCGDRLQAWYRNKTIPQELQIKKLSHDEYCDWLKKE